MHYLVLISVIICDVFFAGHVGRTVGVVKPQKTHSVSRDFKEGLFLSVLLEVESSPSNRSKRGANGEVGPLQITEAVIKDVNEYTNRSFNLADAEDLSVACWICLKYLERYNATTYEEAARLWNGGPNWRDKPKKTETYWKRFKALVEVRLKLRGEE